MEVFTTIALLIALASLNGCSKARENVGQAQSSSSATACAGCHGEGANSAPPRDTHGQTATTLVSVGAHGAHLSPSIGRALECDACHVVPASALSPGHINGTTLVQFTGIANNGSVSPVWDRTTASCSSTYCHGSTLAGGIDTAPRWTLVDGSQKNCGSCHGFPPPAPHSTFNQCSTCHTETMATDGTIANPDKHIDGVVQVVSSTGSCTSCHGSSSTPGSSGNAAPPRDLSGQTSTASVGVGAHQSHLSASIGKNVACNECHVVPASQSSPGHLDGTTDLRFGSLASRSGASPQWNPSSATCSSTYCHGATLPGGANTAPRWTVVNGSQKSCGSCHGFPPPAPHPALSQCSTCHTETMAANGTISNRAKHIDGQLQVSAAACGSCHSIPPSSGRHPSVFENHSFMGKNCATCHAGITNSDGTAILPGAPHNNGTVNVSFSNGSYNPSTKTCTISCHEAKRW